MKKTLAGLGLFVLLSGCGGSPVQPTPPPTPAPTPTATPTTSTNPSTACTPAPPVIYGFRGGVHLDQGYKKILNATPIVKDLAYCTSIGITSEICPVREEGDPQAVSCDNRVTGRSDTGRYGPSWTQNGVPCRGIGVGADDPGCKNHPENQYLLLTFGPGTFTACAEGRLGCKDFTVN